MNVKQVKMIVMQTPRAKIKLTAIHAIATKDFPVTGIPALMWTSAPPGMTIALLPAQRVPTHKEVIPAHATKDLAAMAIDAKTLTNAIPKMPATNMPHVLTALADIAVHVTMAIRAMGFSVPT
jgi:hypothetical protein